MHYILEKIIIVGSCVLDGNVALGSCVFRKAGLFSLLPHAHNKLALLLHASDVTRLADVISLATPTIPPMTRSPVSDVMCVCVCDVNALSVA